MRLEKAVFHNIGPFEHAEIDLESLGDDCKLVALCGVNGAGKTFSLQAAIAGAAYRKMPTQGTLVGRARARDSYVESTLVNGARWVVRHDLDAVSRKGEATVRDAAGEPAYKGTSVKLFDAWSAKHFIAQDVLFATSFAVQKSGGFVDLGSAERISVILEVVGVSRIERMAAADREQVKLARHEFEKLDARLTDERARCGDLAALYHALESARALVAASDQRLEDARVALDLAIEDARVVEVQAKEYTDWAAKRAELETELSAARKAFTDLETRVRNNRAIQAEGDAIRAARAELLELAELDAALTLELASLGQPFDDEAAGIAAEFATQRQAVARAEADARAAKVTLDAARAAAGAATARIQRAKERLTDESDVMGAKGAIAECLPTVEAQRAEIEATETELAAARGLTLAGAADRIAALREGLEMVEALPDVRLDEAAVISRDALGCDAAAARNATEVPARIADLELALADMRRRLRGSEGVIATLERLAARVPEMVAARDELAAAVDDSVAADQAVDGATDVHADIGALLMSELTLEKSIRARREAAAKRRAELEPPAREAIERRRRAIVTRREQVEPLAAKYDRLIATDARLAEIEPQFETARATVARLETIASATPVPPPPPAAPDVAAIRAALEQAERADRAAHSAVAVAEQRVTAAQESHERLSTLQVEVDAATAELADWNRLAQDFGRDGVQSAEVDSAGPELTALTNDLLHSCHGPQFTVSIETSRLSSDGKDQVDECRVQVIDSVGGREGEAREFSGGQSVIIGEAISLALTMLACNRAGLTGITLVRDESGAALDPVAGRAYVKMLRRAADFVGASRCLLVVHNPELAEMCDARILIQDGKVSHG